MFTMFNVNLAANVKSQYREKNKFCMVPLTSGIKKQKVKLRETVAAMAGGGRNGQKPAVIR